MHVPPPNDPLGTILQDRYQIEQLLGQGGMGVVYRAIDTQANHPVALKALRPDKSAANPDLLKRFLREGQILRELDHPNIVRLLDAFEQDGVHYLVMDYVAGGDLSVLIEFGDLPDIPTVLSIAINIADALTRAHHLKVLHRDIKPANVFLADDGTIRLADFGIASLNTDTRLTEEGAILGTIAYLPPEACLGLEQDERSDIWSFGVLLYELLLGETPFSAEQPFAVMQAILHQPLPDIQALRPEISDDLADLLYRMLEKDRQARIPGVRHVGALLEDISRGRTSQPQKSVFDTPPPDIWQRPSHNLPPQSTPFVGREHELAGLIRLLADRKGGFLSIISPGGMGKTRLALALAEKLAIEEERKDSFKDGVYFVELAPLSDPDAIPGAIASATGYRMAMDGREPKQQVLDFLQNKQLLLVLDNFEHLLEASALVEEIVLYAPQVSVVVTSRERLGIPGETIFHLDGMAFPEWETPKDALEYAAVKLFVSSALRARPDFELKAANMDYVARICRLTGGMPLGIVLAASWASVLRTEEIAAELLSGLEILEAAGNEVADRQRSIKTVFEHTWGKLSQGEQQVFAQLSVFRGGFTREAAKAVTGVSLPMLRKLVNQSLITRNVHTGRFAVHELLRQYAWGKLVDREDTEATREMHADYFASFVEERDLDVGRFSQKEIGDTLDSDFENIRSALSWLVQQQHLNALSNMVFPLKAFAYLREIHASEIISMVEEALDALAEGDERRSWKKVYGRLLAIKTVLLPNFRAEPITNVEGISRRGLELVQAAEDEPGLAMAKSNLAWVLSFQAAHHSTAMQFARESAQHCDNANLISMAALNQWAKTLILRRMGSSLKDIEAEVAQGLKLSKQAGDRFGESITLYSHGTDKIILGEYDSAMQIYKQSAAIAEEEGFIPIANSQIASLYVLMGNYRQANRMYEQMLRKFQDVGDLGLVRDSMWGLVEIAALEGRTQDTQALLKTYRETFPERAPDNDFTLGFLAYHEEDYETACRHFEQHLETTEWMGSIVHTSLLLGHSQVRSGHIESARRSLLHGLEKAYRTERRFQYPRAILGIAELANASGDKKDAIRLAGVIHNHSVTPHEVNVMVADLLQSLREEMSSDEYQEALDTGAGLDLDFVAMKLLEDLTNIESTG